MRVSSALQVLILGCAIALASVARAAPVTIDVAGIVTSFSSTYDPVGSGFETRDNIGGVGVGAGVTGQFVITDVALEDSVPGGERDVFSVSGTLPGSNDLRVHLDMGDFSLDSGGVHSGNPYRPSMQLVLEDSADGDVLRLVVRRNFNFQPISSMTLLLRDSTGNAFPGTGNLTGSYSAALALLRDLDLSDFDELKGSFDYEYGNRSITRRSAEFSLQSVQGRVAAYQDGLAVGDVDFISEPLDGARISRGLNGNSQIEDVSRDGRYIAYNTEGSFASASREFAKSMIYDRISDELELFDPAPGAHSGNLMFNEDASQVTFVSNSAELVPDAANESVTAGGDLFTFDRRSDSYTRLTSGFNIKVTKERRVQMSADGNWVVFNNSFQSAPAPAIGYYLLDRRSGSITPLSPDISAGGAQGWVLLSEDGSQLLYKRFSGLELGWELFVYDLATAAERLIASNVDTGYAGISADGNRVGYRALNTDGSRSVYVVDLNGGDPERVLANADGDFLALALSADGEHVLVESTATNLTSQLDPNASGLDLFDLDLTSGLVNRVSRIKPGGLSPHSASFDASVIAFEDDANIYDAEDPNGGYSDVFAWSGSTSGIVRASNTIAAYNIPGGNGSSRASALSGNGRFVVFRSQATDLVEMDSREGTNPRSGPIHTFYHDRELGTTSLLAPSIGGVSNQGLSADGQLVTFSSSVDQITPEDNNGRTDAFLFDNRTGSITNLTQNTAPADFTAGLPALSNDGEKVLFATTAGLQLLNLRDGTTQTLPAYINPVHATLTGDGSKVLVTVETFRDRRIDVVDLTTGQVIDVLDAPGSDGLILAFSSVSDDGRFVAILSQYDWTPNDGRGPGRYLWDRQARLFTLLDDTFSAMAISGDGSVVALSSTNPLAPRPAQCLSSSRAFTYAVETGEYKSLPCSNEFLRDGTNGIYSLSDNGELLLTDVFSRYVATDVSQTFNSVVTRLDGESDEENSPPVAFGQTLQVVGRSDLEITLTGSDPDGDPLEYTVVNLPVHGQLAGFPPNLSYLPDDGYLGSDSFTFQVSDGRTLSETALIEIDVRSSRVHSLRAEQRGDSRIIDITATYPQEAAWTQVREFDGPSSVLWDGQTLLWTGTYVPEPGTDVVTINSRYWIGADVIDSIDVDVILEGVGSEGFTLSGFAWIDDNADSRRDSTEAGDVGRAVDLYRCAPPWGVAGRATSTAPDGEFVIQGLEGGEYQIGTPAAGVDFSAPGNDNLVYPTGFSNCFLVDGNHSAIGIGILSGAAPQIDVSGFVWTDSNADSTRGSAESGVPGREVIMYRCKSPWGIAGSATSDANGEFAIDGVLPGEYQFGTSAEGVQFSPVARDNLMYGNGFSNCVDLTTGARSIGVGLLP